jgi:hypothetical protein
MKLTDTFSEESRVSRDVSPALKRELEMALQQLTPLQKS